MTDQDRLISSIFETRNLHLTPVDPEVDAVIEATWMTDQGYAEDRRPSPARPASAYELQKMMQDELKKMKESSTFIVFAVRRKMDEKLTGFIHFPFILWNHRRATMKNLIGGHEFLTRYGREQLDLSLQYAFMEMNLHRVGVIYPEYRQEAIDLHKEAGFREEIRRRQAHFYHGKYWDLIHLGLLHDERGRLSEED